MAAVLPAQIVSVLDRQGRRLERLKPGHRRRLLRAVRAARRELQRRLDRLPQDRATAQMTRVLLAQVQLAGRVLQQAMEDGLVHVGRAAAEVGRDGLLRQIAVWDKRFPGLIERFAPIELASDLLDPGLLEYYRTSAERYGAEAITRMRGVMATGALQGETLIQTSKRLAKALDMPDWRAETIVRTEHSLAMHRRQLKDLRELVEHEAEWRKMTTGPMDRRTGDDSRRVEGQVRKLDEPFMGDHGRFQHNPDRPRDRGTTVLVPAQAVHR